MLSDSDRESVDSVSILSLEFKWTIRWGGRLKLEFAFQMTMVVKLVDMTLHQLQAMLEMKLHSFQFVRQEPA